ncbi:MAG: amidase [Candidatus Bipolaricaulota bacterium]|nr:MAG: amidase [Candidatus Bipolaricaulota bacterium]
MNVEWLTADEMARRMAAGEASARSLTDRCLDRIERLDRRGPGLHAMLEINPDARSIADRLDEERDGGSVRGPLHGVPVVIKGNIDTSDGMTTTAGSLALAGHIAEDDAFLVRRLRAAGLVLLGKANLSEWANFRGRGSLSGWSSLGGQTRNPHVLDRSPCGSSSGSAVAVAAGYGPLSVGTETDGSIVCPAHMNGVVGLKPTVGLVSRSGIIPIAASQDTAGPMARSVRDVAALLEALCEEDPGDSATAVPREHRARDYTAALGPEGLQGARIGVARGLVTGKPPLSEVLEDAVATIRRLGATVIDPVPMEIPSELRKSEYEVLLYEFKDGVNAYLRRLPPESAVHSLADVIAFNEAHRDRVMPFFGQEAMIESEAKGSLDDDAYREALTTCRRLARTEGLDATLRMHELDALVSLTGGPAWLIDVVHGDYAIAGCSTLAAVAGTPHITVPAGRIGDLPIGLSFFGPAFSEPLLLRLAHAFELGSAPWRPPRFLPSFAARP